MISFSCGRAEKRWNEINKKKDFNLSWSLSLSSLPVCFNYQLPRGSRLYIKLPFSSPLQTWHRDTLAQLNLLANNGFIKYTVFRKADLPHAAHDGVEMESSPWISRLYAKWEWRKKSVFSVIRCKLGIVLVNDQEYEHLLYLLQYTCMRTILTNWSHC